MHLQLLLSKVYLYLRDAFKSAAVTGRWLRSLWKSEVQMYEKRLELEIQRKVAESVAAAEISDRLNAFSNISPNFYLSVFLPLCYPCPSNASPLSQSHTYRSSGPIGKSYHVM